jgi:hypothetical protein
MLARPAATRFMGGGLWMGADSFDPFWGGNSLYMGGYLVPPLSLLSKKRVKRGQKGGKINDLAGFCVVKIWKQRGRVIAEGCGGAQHGARHQMKAPSTFRLRGPQVVSSTTAQLAS